MWTLSRRRLSKGEALRSSKVQRKVTLGRFSNALKAERSALQTRKVLSATKFRFAPDTGTGPPPASYVKLVNLVGGVPPCVAERRSKRARMLRRPMVEKVTLSSLPMLPGLNVSE